MPDNYDTGKHIHIFAAWAASRAASTSAKCRFGVKSGKKLIEAAKLDRLVRSTMDITSAAEFDAFHDRTCQEMIRLTPECGLKVGFTYGVAAKLTNVYLKAAFLPSHSKNSAFCDFIHPPIDRLLMTKLADPKITPAHEAKEWCRLRDVGWSNFSRRDYQDALQAVKRHCGPRPLWTIEEHWPGAQD